MSREAGAEPSPVSRVSGPEWCGRVAGPEGATRSRDDRPTQGEPPRRGRQSSASTREFSFIMDAEEDFAPSRSPRTHWSGAVEQATRDGENCIAALRAGVWVVRYFQPHVIRDSVDWRSYRRDSQSYVVRHATEEPRVIAPATSWDVYCSWASHAGVNPIFM